MKFSALVLGLFAALSVAAPTPDDSTPDFKDLYIDSISYGGTGCKAGTVAVIKADDWKTVTLLFDSYAAKIGPLYPGGNPHLNCVINFKIHYPKGYQYTFYKIDYTGYAKLEKDVVAKQQSTYWFAGFPNGKAILQSTWYGKYDAQYSFTDTLATEALVWSPCGVTTTLNVNTFLDLNNDKDKKASGQISTEVIDANIKNVKFSHIYGVYWRKC